MSLYLPGYPYITTYGATTVPLPGSSTTGSYLNELYQQMIKRNDDVGITPSYPLVYVNENKSTTYTYGTKNGLVSVTYDKLNRDKKTKKTLTKYYFYKIIDKWLYKELMPLLGFVDIQNGNPKLITSMRDYNGEKLLKESKEDLEKKIHYMEKVLLTKDIVKHVLKKIIDKYNIDWAQLEEYEPEVKKYFFNYLKNKLEEAIGGK